MREAGNAEEAAVVWNVSVAVAVPFVAIVIIDPELQVVSDGNPVHTGVTVTAPPLLKPFVPVNVSVVVPLAPGALTGTVVGFAVTVNAGAVDTTVIVMPAEAGEAA